MLRFEHVERLPAEYGAQCAALRRHEQGRVAAGQHSRRGGKAAFRRERNADLDHQLLGIGGARRRAPQLVEPRPEPIELALPEHPRPCVWAAPVTHRARSARSSPPVRSARPVAERARAYRRRPPDAAACACRAAPSPDADRRRVPRAWASWAARAAWPRPAWAPVSAPAWARP